MQQLTKNLPQMAGEIGNIFAENVEEGLFEKTFEAYRGLSANILSKEFIAIRRYDVDRHAPRYVAIPVTRSYRHLFFVHNSFLDRDFLEHITSKTSLLSMDKFLERVQEAAFSELSRRARGTFEYAKAFAVQAFGRSCYASCNGEWNLVLSLVNGGLRKILPTLPNKKVESVQTHEEARGYLLAQELYFQSHLAERALAEATANESMHGSRLARAAAALLQCSIITAKLPRKYVPCNTPYSPMSIRDALAAIGLLIEWTMKGVWRQITIRDQKLPAILFDTDKNDVAWHGVELLTNVSTRADKDSWIRIVEAADIILTRTQECLDAVKADKAPGHSQEMWRYLLLRAYGMMMTARQVQALADQVNTGSDTPSHYAYAGLPSETVKKIHILHNEHTEFIRQCKPAMTQEDAMNRVHGNPFLNGLLAVEAFIAATGEINGGCQVTEISAAMRAFGDLDEYCGKLYRFGFPRMFLRKTKEQFVPLIISNLRATYNPTET